MIYVILDMQQHTVTYVGQTTQPLEKRISRHIENMKYPQSTFFSPLRSLKIGYIICFIFDICTLSSNTTPTPTTQRVGLPNYPRTPILKIGVQGITQSFAFSSTPLRVEPPYYPLNVDSNFHSPMSGPIQLPLYIHP